MKGGGIATSLEVTDFLKNNLGGKKPGLKKTRPAEETDFKPTTRHGKVMMAEK